MPQRRFNSIERIERPLIFGTEIDPSRRSTTRQGMPAMPSSIDSTRPTGPPPAIRTGIASELMTRTVRWASAPVNDGHRPITACLFLGALRALCGPALHSAREAGTISVRTNADERGGTGMAELRDKFAASNVIAMWDQELRPNLPLLPSHIWRWQEMNPLIGESAKAVNMDD